MDSKKKLFDFMNLPHVNRCHINCSEIERMRCIEYLKIIRLYLEKHEQLDDEEKDLIKMFMKIYQTFDIKAT